MQATMAVLTWGLISACAAVAIAAIPAAAMATRGYRISALLSRLTGITPAGVAYLLRKQTRHVHY